MSSETKRTSVIKKAWIQLPAPRQDMAAMIEYDTSWKVIHLIELFANRFSLYPEDVILHAGSQKMDPVVPITDYSMDGVILTGMVSTESDKLISKLLAYMNSWASASSRNPNSPEGYINFKPGNGEYVSVPFLHKQKIKDVIQTYTTQKRLAPGSFKLAINGHPVDERTMESFAYLFPHEQINVIIKKPVEEYGVSVKFASGKNVLVPFNKEDKIKDVAQYIATKNDLKVSDFKLIIEGVQADDVIMEMNALERGLHTIACVHVVPNKKVEASASV